MIAALDYYSMSRLGDFLDAYFVDFSHHTRKQYERILEGFSEWMKQNRKKRAERCNKIDALNYLKWLKSAGLADRTIKKYYIVLNRLYKSAMDFGAVKDNPWPSCKTAISWRRVNDKRPTGYLPPKSISAILESDKSQSLDPVRDQAVLAVLFGVGLRRSEICKLKIGDIMVSPQGTIFLEIKAPKGGKTRRHPVPSWAWKYLSVLVSQRKRQGATEDDYCFITAWSVSHISTEQLYRIYKRWTGLAPHSARASFATQLLMQKFSYEQVARALGHQSTDQVKTYQKRELSVDECVGKLVDYKKSIDDKDE